MILERRDLKKLSSPKIVVRTSYKLSLTNPDRGSIYNNKDKKYIDGITKYFTDDTKRIMNMIDYFTGKINKHEDINLVLENGEYATKEEVDKRQKYISKQFNNSNVWQVVLSIDKELVDKSISWRDLEKNLAKEIIPKMLKQMGFVNLKNMKYEFSLHMNTKHPHFHISFMETKPNTYNKDKKLVYRRKGKIPKDVINVLKNETILAIEREKYFRPLSININKDIEEFKKYFDPTTKNYVLYDKKNILLEEKILNLGKLLNEKVVSNNSRIKFNSIKDEEIIKLTKEIKEELFKDKKSLGITKQEFNKSIKNMNDYLISISESNNLKKEDIDLSYTKNKEKYLNNYLLNAIVNHARYDYKKNKDLFNSNDVFQSIILNNYLEDKKYNKKDVVKDYLTHPPNTNLKKKQEVLNAVKNINRELDEAAEEFYKIGKSKEKVHKSIV